MNSNFIKNFMMTGVGNLFVILFGLLNSVLITRWLGPESKGVYTVVTNIVIFVTLLFGEGLRRSNTIIIAQNKELLKKILSNNLIFLIIIIAISSLALFFSDIIIQLIENIDFNLLLIALLISLFSIMWQATQAIYLGLKMIFQFTMLMISSSLIILLLNFFGIFFFDYGLYEILFSMFFANIFVYILGIIGLYKYTNKQSVSQDFKLKEQFNLTSKSTLVHLEIFVLRRSGIFFLNNLVSAGAVGIFSVAFLFSDLLQRLPNIAGTLVFSKVANNDDSVEMQTAKVVRSMVFLIFLLMVMIVFSSEIIIILLFGIEFSDASLPLATMSVGLILVGAGSVLHSYYMGKSFPKKMIYLNSIVSLFALVINYYFISNFSIIGAGISYSIILSLWSFSYIVIFAKETNISYWNLMIIKKNDLMEIIEFFKKK